MSAETDHFRDKCAVVGVIGDVEASNYCYLGLFAMQHRGQEGAGIVSSDGNYVYAHRDLGLVADVFNSDTLSSLSGDLAIGHTRYATYGSKDWQNLQPFVANFGSNSFAVAHNGNLTNATEIRLELERQGSIFSATSDTEVILHLLAHTDPALTDAERLKQALSKVQGAFSLAVMSLDKLIGARDSSGIRPLSLAKIGEGYMLASETCAFDLVGAHFIRDILPGEVLEIHRDGTLVSTMLEEKSEPAFCVFEYIYFSRPDSNLFGKNVYQIRKSLGRELAREHPVEADLVVPIPDSGVPAAMGFSEELKIPLELGLIRNHYVGRTFIEPKQSIRDFGVKVKLNAIEKLLKGKRIVLVDDSIVRGTTSQKIVSIVKSVGAKEVHMRISCPPTIGPCYYGIDTPSARELIAYTHTNEEICNFIGASTLGYLSHKGMYRALEGEPESYCDACFTGNYKRGVPKTCNLGAEVVKPVTRAKNFSKKY